MFEPRVDKTRTISLSTAGVLITVALAFGDASPVDAAEPGLVPRTLPQKSVMASIGVGRDPHTLVMKLRDGADATAHDGRLRSGAAGRLAPGEVDAVMQVLKASPGVRVEPLFTVPTELLDLLRKIGERNTGEALADLTQTFLVRVSQEADPLSLLEGLLPIDAVENVYAYGEPRAPADLPPTTPDFLTMPPGQGYRDPAPEGIGIDFAWSQGFRGEGVSVVDLEQNFNLSHEDLDQVAAPGLPRAIIPPFDWRDPALPALTNINHGTAVLGVLAAGDNGYGVSGLIPGSTVRVIPAFRNSDLTWLPTNSVVLAILNMAPGDVLLIELEDPAGQPFETFDVEFAVVRQAVALGIHVIQPAGNGGLDLDSLTVGATPPPFDLSVRDSGAVLVGAGESDLPLNEDRRDRVAISNFGTRVDSHSWGQNIVTLGYGFSAFFGNCTTTPQNPFPIAPNLDQWYTNCFNGTSGAGAIVAGAAAVLEQMHEEAFGQPMGPRELRNMLRMGTGANDPIGHQPDLRYAKRFLDEGGLITHRYQADPPIDTTQEFGRSVASVGDLDADGTPDQVVGIPGADGDTGRIQVISGATGRTLQEISGLGPGDRFGAAVAGGLDYTGDDRPDFVVGAPGGAGRVTVFDGSDFSIACDITSFSSDEAFGFSVAMVPDVEGNSQAEVLIGAPGRDPSSVPGWIGKAYLWSGFTGGCGVLLDTFSVTQPESRFGFAVASAGDVDGNGVPDLLIGAPNMNDSQNRFPGAAFLFNGNDPTAPLRSFGGAVAGGVASFSFFGGAVDAAGDFNNDGRRDVIIGAPSWAPGAGSDFGKAYVYSGTGRLIRSFTGQVADGRMGAAVAGLGDFDGDGLDDVAVGRPGAPADTTTGFPGRAGRVFVFPAQAKGGTSIGTAPSQRVFWRAQESNLSLLGTSVSAAGDVNGDGLADLLAGEPAGELGGRAYVFSFGPAPDLLTARPRLLVDVGVIEAEDRNNDGNGGGLLSPSTVTFTIDAGPAWAGASYQLIGVPNPPWDQNNAAQNLVAPGSPFLSGSSGVLDGQGQSSMPVFGPIPATTLCPQLVGGEFTFRVMLTSAGGDTGSLPARVDIINESGGC